ncbi:hypothetical protein PRIPAC_72184 [Pristionchus pacificus]|uniref:Uncharacterized protein n=1 Tax=Pristionchus pacificus TaxID=54126 RepID=A0A454Y295_PRIPA|nr:hypothetical protein PRIPAC_72184 [Pristionchus pacificus]|eukprot:PDM71506.1 hypothetical protein PRIPAC_37913 [Pristionchus pacificus]
MHFSFLLFTSALFAFASADEIQSFPPELLAVFKEFNAAAFLKELHEAGSAKETRNSAMNVLCKYSYCHAEARKDCADLCAAAAPKFDEKVVGNRIQKIDKSVQPDADKAACEKECAIDCGNNDCKKECPALCEIHWSYKNRKEYEGEVFQFIARINEFSKLNQTKP